MENNEMKLYIITGGYENTFEYLANTFEDAKKVIKNVKNPTIIEYTLIDGKWEETDEDMFYLLSKDDLKD